MQQAQRTVDTELVFRITLLVLFATFIAHRGYYTRKMGARTDKTVQERRETTMTRVSGMLALVALGSVIVYIVNPAWLAWAALPLPIWLRWMGVAVALAGFALLQWSQMSLGKNWSDTPRLMREQQLVTAGPYQWIRHPIYTAFLLILTSTLLITANWFIGTLWIVTTTIDVMARVQFEETLLSATFGDSYRTYASRTGRLLPRLLGTK